MNKYEADRMRWFIFGEHAADGTVDVADHDGDVMIGVTRAVAEEAIRGRDRLIELLAKSTGRSGNGSD